MADIRPPLHEGYSIWFTLEDSQQKQLQRHISRLAKKFGGNDFLAHGTVIGLLDKKAAELEDLEEKTQQLAKQCSPFEIEVIGFGARDAYFQSLFLVIAPPLPLVDMNAKARKLFGHESDPPFMPHLSLMYGMFDWKTKQAAAKTLKLEFPVKYKVRSIALVNVEGNAEQWWNVREYPLAS